MNGLIGPFLACVFAAAAGAQATHNGSIWIDGPDGVLEPDTTYTLDVWGRVESPLFTDGFSMIGGFGVSIFNTGGGESVAGVSNVRIEPWASAFGNEGAILGRDILAVSGGRLPQDFPIDPPDLLNPILLFSFDMTTAIGPLGRISFSPADPDLVGGLMFYLDWSNGASVTIPTEPDSAMHFASWASAVPSPAGLVPLGAVALLRRRR